MFKNRVKKSIFSRQAWANSPFRVALIIKKRERMGVGDHRVIKDLIPMDEASIGLCGWLPLCFAALFCSDLTAHIVGVYHFMAI
jgi:hypothetical protein